MHTKYYFLHSFLIFGLIVIIACLVSTQSHTSIPVTTQIIEATTTETTLRSENILGQDVSRHSPIATSSNATTSITQSTSTKIELIVGTSTYQMTAHEKETLIDAMHDLMNKDPTFTFAGRDFPGLGFFVTSINGKTAEHGYNWMLYTDGKPADTGASNLIINNYSSIEWKYEQ